MLTGCRPAGVTRKVVGRPIVRSEPGKMDDAYTLPYPGGTAIGTGTGTGAVLAEGPATVVVEALVVPVAEEERLRGAAELGPDGIGPRMMPSSLVVRTVRVCCGELLEAGAGTAAFAASEVVPAVVPAAPSPDVRLRNISSMARL